MFQVQHITKAYGDKVILKNTSATINRGDKIALIGANGKGKSTLLRIISGSEKIEGERRTGHNVIESFFAQHHQELTAECYLPLMVQAGIQQHVCSVKVLSSHEQWVGLTFPQDKDMVVQHLHELTTRNVYPKTFSHE